MKANKINAINHPFCALWYWNNDMILDLCFNATWDRLWSFFPYQSHEFRDLPLNYDDWTGVEFDVPYPVQMFGMWIQNPSELNKVDYKMYGRLEDPTYWIKWIEDTKILQKIHPFKDEKGYDENCDKKYKFSWEKETSCLNGYWHKWPMPNGNWLKLFFSYYTSLLEHYWWRFAFIENYFFSDFKSIINPLNLKIVRVRHMNNGQKAQGYMWYRTGVLQFFHINMRHVVIRTPKFLEGKPICLADTEPDNTWKDRMLDGQRCDIAAAVADGRELFGLAAFPGIVKWNNEGLKVYRNGNSIMMKPGGFGEPSTITFTKDRNLMSYYGNKCLDVGSTLEVKWHNMVQNYYASSQKKEAKNDLINIFFDNQKSYKWVPNEFNSVLQVNFKSNNTLLRGLNVEWNKPPEVYVVYCYNHKWYVQDIVFTKGDKKQYIKFIWSTCRSIYLKVLKLGKGNKCPEGSCLELLRFSPDASASKKLVWNKCEYNTYKDKKTDNLSMIWFYEPEMISTLYPAKWWLNQSVIWRNHYFITLLKFRNYKIKFKAMKTIIEEDTPTDFLVDRNIRFEICKSARCYKKDKKNVPKLNRELLNLAPRFFISSNSSGNGDSEVLYGESRNHYANSCNFIKTVYSNNVNGYYWIKNHCTDTPVKAYCNMNVRHPIGYYLHSGDNRHVFDMKNQFRMRKPGDFSRICARFGMKVARIHYIEDIYNAVMLSFDQNYQFNRNQGILIGYDFSCSTWKGCSGKYHSLDGSTELNKIAIEFNKRVDSDFERGWWSDSLVLIDGRIKSKKLSWTSINSILCSTIDEYDFNKITCDTTLNDLGLFSTQFVGCPNDCLNDEKPLNGKFVYSASSSICKAVAMSNEFVEHENMLWAAISTSKALISKFEGGAMNEVKSTPKDEQMKYFTITKFSDYIDGCPSIRPETTFLQSKMMIQPGMSFQDYLNQYRHKKKQEDKPFKTVSIENMFKHYSIKAFNNYKTKVNNKKKEKKVKKKSHKFKLNGDQSLENYLKNYSIKQFEKYENTRIIEDRHIKNRKLKNNQSLENMLKSYSPDQYNNFKNTRIIKHKKHINSHNLSIKNMFKNYSLEKFNEFHKNNIIKHKIKIDKNQSLMNLFKTYSIKEYNKLNNKQVPKIKKIPQLKIENILNSYHPLPKKTKHAIFNSLADKFNHYHDLYNKKYHYKNINTKSLNYINTTIPEQPKPKNRIDLNEIMKAKLKYLEMYKKMHKKIDPEVGSKKQMQYPILTSKQKHIPVSSYRKMFENYYVDILNENIIKKPNYYNQFRFREQNTVKNKNMSYAEYESNKINTIIDNIKTDDKFKKVGSLDQFRDFATKESMNVVKQSESQMLDINNFEFKEFSRISKLEVKNEFNARLEQTYFSNNHNHTHNVSSSPYDFKFKEKKVKWTDIYKKQSKDLRSDYQLNTRKYYKASSEAGTYWSKLGKAYGDKSHLSEFKLDINNNFEIAYKYMREYRKNKHIVYKLMNFDIKSMEDHYPIVDTAYSEYQKLMSYAIFLTRIANKMIRYEEQVYISLEAHFLNMFKYNNFKFYYDIVSGISMPLPDAFKIEDSPGNTSNWKYSKDSADSNHHKQVYIQYNKLKPPLTKDKQDNWFSTIVSTRYIKSYDGELNMSFSVNNNKAHKFGILFRYNDQFLHYALEFDYKKKYIYLLRRGTKGDDTFTKSVMIVKVDELNAYNWYHAKIKFNKYLIRVTVNSKYKELTDFSVYDAGYLNGGIGWYCDICKHVTVDNVQIKQDKCFVKDNSFENSTIFSPFTFRYYEKYYVPINLVYKMYEYKTSNEKYNWKFIKANFKHKNAITQTSLHNNASLINKNTHSTGIYLKNENYICAKYCLINVDALILDKYNGLYSIIFKQKSIKDYLSVNVHVNSNKKNKITIVYRNPDKIIKISQIINSIKIVNKKYYKFRIKIRENTMDLWIKDERWKVIYNNLKISQLLSLNGTIGLGTNNMAVNFDKLWIKYLNNDRYKGNTRYYKNNKNANKNSKNTKAKELNHEFDYFDELVAKSLESKSSQNDRSLKLIKVSKCSNRNLSSRRDFCINNTIISKNVDSCVADFCPVCCTFSVELSMMGKCVDECNSSSDIKKQKLKEDDVSKCYDQRYYNQQSRLMSCLGCCSLLKGPLIDSDSIRQCEDMCYINHWKGPNLSFDYFDNQAI